MKQRADDTTSNLTADRRLTRTMRTMVLALALIALLGASCSTVRGDLVEVGMSQPGESAAGGGGLADEATAAESAIEVGDAIIPEAWQFATNGLDGEAIYGGDLFEQRPLIISFVVPSCAICTREAPAIAEASELHGEVSWVMVHTGGTAEEYSQFIETTGSFTEAMLHIDDTDFAFGTRFSITDLPSSLLVDVDGRISVANGALEHEGLQRAVDKVTAPALTG